MDAAGYARRGWALATLAVLPSLVWYVHAYYVSISSPPYPFFGSGAVGLGSLKDYAGIAEEVFFVSLTPAVAVLASIGLFVRPRRPGGYVFLTAHGGTRSLRPRRRTLEVHYIVKRAQGLHA